MGNFQNTKSKILFISGILFLTVGLGISYQPSSANFVPQKLVNQINLDNKNAETGILKGEVVIPDGVETITGFRVRINTFYPLHYEYTEVDFVDTMEFEFAVPEGEYQFLLQSFTPLVTAFETDEPVVIKVGQTLDLGKIPLISASSTVSGKFITSSGDLIPSTRFTLVNLSCENPYVFETPGRCVNFNRFEGTDELGEYEVRLSPGEWELAVSASTNYAFLGPPIRIEVEADTVISDFDVVFQAPNSRVRGNILDENGELIEGHQFNINATVDGSYHYVAPIETSNGMFEFPAVEGDYTINISPAFDDIDYFIPHTVTVTVPTNDSEVNFEIVGLLPSAVLKGEFVDYRTGEAVTGLSGAITGNSDLYWKSARTFFDSDDVEYELNLPKGKWDISFDIDDRNVEHQYDPILHRDTSVDVLKNSEVILDMPVVKVDASVSGQVIDPLGAGVSNIRIYLEGQEELTGLNKILELDGQGLFEFDLPQGIYRVKIVHRSSDPGSYIPSLDGSFIAPAASTLILEPGENRTNFNIQYQYANSQLSTAFYVPGLLESGELDFYITNGNTSRYKRVQVLSDGSNGIGQVTLELGDGEWEIQASMEAREMSWELTKQVIVQGDTEAALALKPSTSAADSAEVVISPQENTVVELSNGAMIEADAGFLEDDRFVSTLSLSIEEVFPINDEFVPVGPSYMVAAKNGFDDVFRSKALNHPITVSLPFDGVLPETVLVSDLVVMSRLYPNDHPNQPSTPLENVVVDTDNQTISFTIDRLGFISIMAPKNLVPAVPTFNDLFGNKSILPIIIN